MEKPMLEKLRPEPKFSVMDIDQEESVKISQEPQGLDYGVTYENFNAISSCLNWIIYNNTSLDYDFVLVRGTPLVKPYAFLNFYTEVYKAFGIISFITNDNRHLDYNYNNPYRVGLVQDSNNNINYAGVFNVPAKKKLILEECGFSQPNNLPNYYQVFPTFPEKTHEYIVEYNPTEIALYTIETGIPVLNAPFPIYLQEVEKYTVDHKIPFANPRTFYKTTWLKKKMFKYLGI